MNNDSWKEFVKDVKRFPSRKQKIRPEPSEKIEIPYKEKTPPPINYKPSMPNKPEAKLDLHGLTLEQAHKEFINFIKLAKEYNLKFLLIVTGKAARSPGSTIKRELPLWIESSHEISNLVKSIKPAEKKHGGDGAFYVFLKS